MEFRERFEIVFDYWNSLYREEKNGLKIVVHTKPSSDMVKAYRKRYRENINVQNAIRNYFAVYNSPETWWSHTYPLHRFLSKAVLDFKDLTEEEAITKYNFSFFISFLKY